MIYFSHAIIRTPVGFSYRNLESAINNHDADKLITWVFVWFATGQQLSTMRSCLQQPEIGVILRLIHLTI